MYEPARLWKYTTNVILTTSKIGHSIAESLKQQNLNGVIELHPLGLDEEMVKFVRLSYFYSRQPLMPVLISLSFRQASVSPVYYMRSLPCSRM